MHALSAAALHVHERSRPLPGSTARLVLWLYAAVVGGVGTFVFGWGPMWLGTVDFPGQPFGRAAIVRASGAVIMAFGCCAAGVAAVDDPRARRRALDWFTGGLAIVFFALLTQRSAIWGVGPADPVLWLLAVGIVGLVAADHEYVLARLVRTIGGSAPDPASRLYSAHERRIREVVSQEERNRLARDLHDSIKQQLFAIQTAAATAQTRFDSDAAGARLALDRVRAAARDAIVEMEVMLSQLRADPLANAGLVEALKKQCEALGFRTGAQVDFRLGTLPPDAALTPGTREAVFRVAQEALANVARHARAANVTVSLGSASGRLDLTVQDDGAGFVAPAPDGHRQGMGMENMAARAAEVGGSLAISSRIRPGSEDAGAPAPCASSMPPGDGTTVRFSVPCYAAARARSIAVAVLCGALLIGSMVGFKYDRRLSMVVGAASVLGLAWSSQQHYGRRRHLEEGL